MNWTKISKVAKIIKLITPIIFRIVDMVEDAHSPDSEGGSKVTKYEREQIIIETIATIPEIVAQSIQSL